MATSPEGPLIFVSYSREDSDWMVRFQTMLKPLVRNRRLELWSDAAIGAGSRWKVDIANAIARADAALLLVSPDYLNSDFIMEWELPELTKRGVPLVPVLLRPCRFADVPALRSLQWAHDPVRDGDLAGAVNVEGAIVRVCDAVMNLVDTTRGLATRRRFALSSLDGQLDAVQHVPALSTTTTLGAVTGVPPPPLGFVEREELGALRAALLGAGRGAVGITGGGALGLHGHGGIGKTVLAAAVGRDEAVRRYFPDGVHWVSVGEQPDLVACQIDLLLQLGAARSDVRTTIQGLARLRERLADRRCLIIVDDVWTQAAAEAFRVTGPDGRVLYTTRDPATLRNVRADVRPIEVLSRGTARELLASLTGDQVDALPSAVDRILVATGRVVLAVALVGAAVGRGGRTWQEVANELDGARETFLDHPYANIFKALQVAVSALEVDLAMAHESLAVYPEDTRVPVTAIVRWWGHLYDLSSSGARTWLENLAASKLLTLDGDIVTLHDLQRDFLLLRVESLSLLHHELLAAYRKALLADAEPWRKLPATEPYIWEHLLSHVCASGDAAGALELTTDLGFLAWRLFRSGAHAAETDVRRAAALHPDDAALAWVMRRISQSVDLLTGHSRISDLAATLATLSLTAPHGVNQAGLRELMPAQVLRPAWGLRDGPDALLRVLLGHYGGVQAVAFASHGRSLASAGDDGTVRLWDPRDGSQRTLLEGHVGPGLAVAFAPDGHTLATGGEDGTVRIWDTKDGSQRSLLNGHDGAVLGVAFASDGQSVASAGDDGTLRWWDTRRATERAVVDDRRGGPVLAVAYAPDGMLLAGACHDGSIGLWNGDGEPQQRLDGHRGYVLAVDFSPDGRTLASAGDDGTVRLWDPATGTQHSVLVGHRGLVLGVTFAPDGRTIASVGSDETVRLWDAIDAQARLIEEHVPGVRAVAFAPIGGTLATAGDDGAIRLWDPVPPARVNAVENRAGVGVVAFTDDGRTLATGGDDGTVRLWDPSLGAPRAVIGQHRGPVVAIAFAPAGKMLATAGRGDDVHLWDWERAVVTAFLKPAGEVHALAFGPGLDTLAAACDRTIRVWDLTKPRGDSRPLDLQVANGPVLALAAAPAGRSDGAVSLASGRDDGAIQLWDIMRPPRARGTDPMVAVLGSSRLELLDLRTGKGEALGSGRQVSIPTLRGHDGPVLGVAFAPDGASLASAGDDATVRVWDRGRRAERLVLHGHLGSVLAVAFTPDGATLVSVGQDGTIRLWDPETGMQRVCVRVGAMVTTLAATVHGVAVGVGRELAFLQIIRVDQWAPGAVPATAAESSPTPPPGTVAAPSPPPGSRWRRRSKARWTRPRDDR